MTQLVDATLDTAVILVSLLAAIFTAGVVWRVERKVDLAYKFFLAAISAFALSEILKIFRFETREWIETLSLVLRLGFALFFLKGILVMRRVVRLMDGEIEPEKE